MTALPNVLPPSNPDPRSILVIGATGGIGGEVAKRFVLKGWRVRGLARDPEAAALKAAWLGPIDWCAGDAMRADDVIHAAAGVDVIFHGANPPGYRNWRGLAIPMLENSIVAARSAGARLIFPGNIYNYGPDAGALLDEAAPQHPLTRKGKVRVEMERMLEAAAATGVRSLVLRAGDFFGAHQPASWFGNAMIRPGRPVRAVWYPGDPAVGHAWAYLPDLAEAVFRLAVVEASLPAFDRYHFGGHWCEPGGALVDAIARVSARAKLPVRRLPWTLFYLAAPFATFFREALEMRYLWQLPRRLDNRKLVALLGEEPHTPIDAAMTAVLTELGCLSSVA